MSDASLEVIKKFQGHDNEEVDHLPFTKEAFSEALMEFIIGDDVVSDNGHMKLYSLSFGLVHEHCAVPKTPESFFHS